MCSLKSLHCTECALLDSVPFCTGKDVSNLSHSVWSRLFFNLFPSPFFCVTNFNAVYLESQRYCERAHSSIAHFFFSSVSVSLARSSFFFIQLIFSVVLLSLYVLLDVLCVCVCLCFSFIFGFILKQRRTRVELLLSIPSFCSTTNCQSKFDKKCKIRVTWNDVKT